jgi:hypothetical protein
MHKNINLLTEKYQAAGSKQEGRLGIKKHEV